MAPGFNMMTLYVDSNPSGNSTSPCWNIIGWGEVRHPTFVLQATWTILPGEIMQSFPFIFTTTFSCSWDWIRLTDDKCFYLANIGIIECLFKQFVKKIKITTFFRNMSNGIEHHNWMVDMVGCD